MTTLDGSPDPGMVCVALAVLVAMVWRRAHGNGAKALARVETSPVQELPSGRPAEQSGPVERRQDGRVTAAGARALGARGGHATARRSRLATQLANNLGLANVGPALAPYVDACADFARTKIADLAATIGGGELGPGPASIIHSAALALAASRWAYATASETGDPALFATAARLGDQSRQALLTAHELAAREAAARPRKPNPAWPWLGGGEPEEQATPEPEEQATPEPEGSATADVEPAAGSGGEPC